MRERILRMESVVKLSELSVMPQDKLVKALVHKSRLVFEKNYTANIAALLKNFPADYVDDKGVKFWTAPKMTPSVLEYTQTDNDCVEFIFHSVNLFCYIFGLPEIKD